MSEAATDMNRQTPLIDCSVAIIGCGPTGLVAASLLGQAGHQVTLIERWKSLYNLPRLSHIDGELG